MSSLFGDNKFNLTFQKPVKSWSRVEVGQFLKHLRFSDRVISSFRKENIMGYHLLVMTNDVLKKDLKVKELSTRLDLIYVLQEIKKNKGLFDCDSPIVQLVRRSLESGIVTSPFSRTYQFIGYKEKLKTIKQKVLKKIGGKIPPNMKPKEFEDYCGNLIDPAMLKENYLNKDFDGIKKLLQRFPKGKHTIFASKSEQSSGGITFHHSNYDIKEEHLDDISKDVIPVLEFEESKKQFKKLKVNSSISIKLVITEIAKQNKKKLFRKVFSPILFGFKRQQEFGFFHSSLIVGPWYLEWNDSSVCTPRKCYSKAALFCADIKRIDKKNIDDVIGKVADVVCEWNTRKTYHRTKANCQHFVDDVLNNIGVSIPYNNVLGHFLTKLRKNGTYEAKWKPCKALKKKCGLKKKYVFTSHTQIDKLVLEVMTKEILFCENYLEEYNFLKSFDRAFWLRHYQSKKRGIKNPKFVPLEDDSKKLLCPFGNPEKASFLSEWF